MENIWHTSIIILSAIVLSIDCRPSCKFDSEKLATTCIAGDSDYILKRGLVSDNNATTGISLRQCRITDIQPSSFNGLFMLKRLDLSENMIQTLKLGVLDGAREVTHLNLSHNLITDLPLGLFDQKTKLQLLDLKGNSLTSFHLGIFDPLPHLGHLDLSSNNFQGQYLSPFLFDKAPVIHYMDFSGSVMTDTPDNLLKAFKRIGFLNLSGCSLTEVPKFATATNLKTMYHLMLINNVITEIDNPLTFKNLINMQMLNFAGNSIDTINKDVFKPLRKLKSVVLAGNRLRDIDTDLFRNLESLTDLDLSGNEIESVDVNAFRGTSLKNLNLANNRFTYLVDNFILELANTNKASLKKFLFNGNPWQCACLLDIIKEAKSRSVDYNDYLFDGKKVECVTTREFNCKRQPNFNGVYVEMYDNLIQ